MTNPGSQRGSGFNVVDGSEDRVLVGSFPFLALAHEHSESSAPAMLRKGIDLIKTAWERDGELPESIGQALGWLQDAAGIFDKVRSRALDLFVAEFQRVQERVAEKRQQLEQATQAKIDQAINLNQARVDWTTAVEEFDQATADLERAYRECQEAHLALMHLQAAQETQAIA